MKSHLQNVLALDRTNFSLLKGSHGSGVSAHLKISLLACVLEHTVILLLGHLTRAPSSV